MKNVRKNMAKGIAAALNQALFFEANATSSFMVYEPQAPKELKNFRRTK